MIYLKVAWIHDFLDEPILIYSEINENGDECRKIEIYDDDSFGIASKDIEFGGTALSLEPVPDINTINKDLQFIPNVIPKEEFEYLWNEYIHNIKDLI